MPPGQRASQGAPLPGSCGQNPVSVGPWTSPSSSRRLLLLHEPLETTRSLRLVLGPSPTCGLPGEDRGQRRLQGFLKAQDSA